MWGAFICNPVLSNEIRYAILLRNVSLLLLEISGGPNQNQPCAKELPAKLVHLVMPDAFYFDIRRCMVNPLIHDKPKTCIKNN